MYIPTIESFRQVQGTSFQQSIHTLVSKLPGCSHGAETGPSMDIDVFFGKWKRLLYLKVGGDKHYKRLIKIRMQNAHRTTGTCLAIKKSKCVNTWKHSS